MHINLQDKIILVTGAAGLLGRSFVKAILENSGICIIADTNEVSGKEFLKELSEEAKTKNIAYVKFDITSKQSISNGIRYILKKYGRIDALVNNAYPKIEHYGRKFEHVSYRDFCKNVNLHLGGYFLTTQQVAKVMLKQGHGNIINMGSIYGFAAPRFEIYENTNITMPVEYAAIKGAIINLTRYLASYLGKHNIRVNSISPGGVKNNQPKSFIKSYTQKVLLGRRMAATDDLTGVLVFLLSDASKYITGQNIIVDGGWSI